MEKIKSIFEPIVLNAKNMMVDLYIGSATNIDQFKVFKLYYDFDKWSDYSRWAMISTNPEWTTERVWEE